MPIRPTDDIEFRLKNEGYTNIIGVDEAGRGGCALSVVAAAVIIPEGMDTSELNDSKKLSESKREKLAEYIKERCVYSMGVVDETIIDEINILQATMLAMRTAINDLRDVKNGYAIIDGNRTPKLTVVPCRAVVDGDALSVSIAAASILAKVHRDALVLEAHKKFPIYGWDKNKTYLTKQHRDAIKLYGPCIYHRKTFSGVREYL